jgi:indolepyruvate ferredoxin oxidoreductase beta subunit
MKRDVVNIIFAGLGGQGVITASDIVAEAAFQSGLDVKKAEVHGMSQRGGSVTSDVRYGQSVLSPMVPAGEGHYLVALDAAEVEASRHRLAPDGVILSVASVDTAALPNAKALNVAMVGMLSAYLDIPEAAWLAAIRGNLPERLHAVNEQTFQFGRNAAG